MEPDSQQVLPYLNSSSSSPTVDPVTKAVVDNILGKLPAKKEKVTLKCTLCNLEFSSQIPLDMHLRGNKHNKKVLSQEIMKTLKEEGSYVDIGASDLKCEVCNVTSNSSQQLQMHLKGAKHMNKVKALGTKSEEKTTVPASGKLKRPRPTGNDEGDGAPPAKSSVTRCKTCNISLNSESQYQQHVESQKHKNRLSGIKPVPKKWGNKQKNNNYGSNQQFPGNGFDFQNGRKSFVSGIPPLSQSFNMEKKNFNMEKKNFNMEKRNFDMEKRNFNMENRNFNMENRNFNMENRNFNEGNFNDRNFNDRNFNNERNYNNYYDSGPDMPMSNRW